MNLNRNYITALLSFFVLAVLVGCQRGPAQPDVLRGNIFGTFYEISISAEESIDREQLKIGILDVLNEVDRQMSTYRDDSVLTKLNTTPIGEPIQVPDELFYVLKTAERISQLSAGAFDTTVGGLVNLWGFGPEGRITHVPDIEELATRLQQVGYRFVVLNEEEQTVTRMSDVFVDLSGIAKGFAADQVADYLHSQGLDNFLVNLGGDLKASGMRSNERPWRIGIEVPTDQQQIAQHIMPVKNTALLGSGDYRNYFEENGIRFSHTINPTTGHPIRHRLAAVHVVMSSATEADAWATAFMVLGEEEGVELANKEEIAAIFVYRNNGEFQSIMTDAFVREHADNLVVPTVH